MRIAFLAAEYPDVPIERGRVRIGSGPDNGLVLDARSGILPMHLQIDVDGRRGIVLAVLDPDARVWVNGRPVHEKALLRTGDLVVAGQVRMQIRGDEDPQPAPGKGLEGTKASALGPTTPLLRGVAGQYVGRMIYLQGETQVGNSETAQLQLDSADAPAKWLRVEARQGQLALYVADGAPAVGVNGVDVRSALLQSGDQVAIGQDRFVIEAPGWSAQAERPSVAHTQVVSPIVRPPAAAGVAIADAGASSETAGEATVDWIILAAAIVTIVALGTLVYLQFWG
ncbi:MAG: FHA domain-containing protein [Lysobacterales bacterium]